MIAMYLNLLLVVWSVSCYSITISNGSTTLSNSSSLLKRQYFQPPGLSDIEPDYLSALQRFQNTEQYNSPPDVWVTQKLSGYRYIIPNWLTWGKNGRKVQEISYRRNKIHGIDVKDRKNQTVIRCRQDNSTSLFCNCYYETCIYKLNYKTWSRWEYYSRDFSIKRKHIKYFWKQAYCRPIQRCSNPNGYTSMKGYTWRRVCHVRWNRDDNTCNVKSTVGRDGLELEQDEDSLIDNQSK